MMGIRVVPRTDLVPFVGMWSFFVFKKGYELKGDMYEREIAKY